MTMVLQVDQDTQSNLEVSTDVKPGGLGSLLYKSTLWMKLNGKLSQKTGLIT